MGSGPGFDRRAVVGGLSTLGMAPAGLARADPAGADARPDVQGKTSWSESFMVLYLSDDLRTGISYRICRFPDLNDTWVWCHAIVEGKLYAYTAQYLPCTVRHNAPTDAAAIYDAQGFDGAVTRVGTSAELQRVDFRFRAGAFAGTDPHEGAGPVPIALEGVFTPTHLHAPIQPGRFERMGRIEATLTVAGKRHTLSGVCKQHEQTQVAPRFGPSFTYCDIWNADASLVGLLTARISGGDYQVGDASRKIAKFEASAPGPSRQVMVTLAHGAQLTGVAEASLTYSIPVYDRVWLGAMVSVTLGGQRFVGALNDWKPELQPYAAEPA